jgi:hypothetical protein
VAALALVALAGCRISREGEARGAVDGGPGTLAEPRSAGASPAPLLEQEAPSPLRDDAGTPEPFFALAPVKPATSGATEPAPAVERAAEAHAPVPPPAPTEDAGTASAREPENPQAAVLVQGRGLPASTLDQVAREACRGVAAERPMWRTLDEGLRSLSCALRARGRAPREALIMGTDGRLGATGALPFDLDPARVAAVVRDRALGMVTGEGARALAGARGSFGCSEPPAERDGTASWDSSYALLVLRDLRGTITAGLLSAPPLGRPEGFLSASVAPGDFLFVQGSAAAFVFGPDVRLRAQARARSLQQHAARSGAELSRDDPLLQDVESFAWLDAARVTATDPHGTRMEWPTGGVPEACRTQPSSAARAAPSETAPPEPVPEAAPEPAPEPPRRAAPEVAP